MSCLWYGTHRDVQGEWYEVVDVHVEHECDEALQGRLRDERLGERWIQVPVSGVEWLVEERAEQAHERDEHEQDEKEDHVLVESALDTRALSRLRVEVLHHFGLFARVDGAAVYVRRDLELGAAQQHVVVANRVGVLVDLNWAFEIVESIVRLLVGD